MKTTITHDEIVELCKRKILDNNPDIGKIETKQCFFTIDGDEIDDERVDIEFTFDEAR